MLLFFPNNLEFCAAKKESIEILKILGFIINNRGVTCLKKME